MKYTPTIGLEIHAELKTRTKMFCNSKNDPDEKKPNTNVCPVCMAHPGTLPVINKEAVRHVLKMGLAVGGTLADVTEFDRKNYFYPDIPKGYQISQYKYPLVEGGNLVGVQITRIHLEEDTARSTHDTGDYSLVDFNRAGIPLMELVTEPVVKDAKQALTFARELQLLLRYIGAGEANMEKGEMRVEANISVSDTDVFGTKVEVKNLNSFRAVERAIAYEIERQTSLLEKGEKVIQETRGWNENKQVTFSQRLKEESHDYRYLPDPDLPKLKISDIPEFSTETLKKELPELLPWERRESLIGKYNMEPNIAEIFVRDELLYNFFEEVKKRLHNEKQNKLAINYITSDLLGLVGESRDFVITPGEFAQIVELVDEGTFSSRSAKGTLELIYRYNKKGDPKDIEVKDFAQGRGLHQISDERVLKETVHTIIEENEQAVLEYKGGKESSLQFLIGQGMKATKGSANPQLLKKLIEEEIS